MSTAFVSLFFSIIIGACQSASPPGTGWRQSIDDSNKWYSIIATTKKNWTEAKAFCNNIAPNAHLTSISTAFESVELNAFTINAEDISSCDQIWIGASDPQLNGQFVWSDGTPLEYSIWQTGEPNLQYQCVSSSWEKSRNWKTTDCSLENCFICEVHMDDWCSTSPPPTSMPSTAASKRTSAVNSPTATPSAAPTIMTDTTASSTVTLAQTSAVNSMTTVPTAAPTIMTDSTAPTTTTSAQTTAFNSPTIISTAVPTTVIDTTLPSTTTLAQTSIINSPTTTPTAASITMTDTTAPSTVTLAQTSLVNSPTATAIAMTDTTASSTVTLAQTSAVNSSPAKSTAAPTTMIYTTIPLIATSAQTSAVNSPTLISTAVPTTMAETAIPSTTTMAHTSAVYSPTATSTAAPTTMIDTTTLSTSSSAQTSTVNSPTAISTAAPTNIIETTTPSMTTPPPTTVQTGTTMGLSTITTADPCLSDPCQNHGICVAVGSSYTCHCATQYTGTNCENAICLNQECLNGGTCKTDNVTFVCKCASCFMGTFCEYDPCTINEDPCENEGTCQYDSQTCSTMCHCKNGTIGHFCEGHDPCVDVPCHNGGTCRSINGTSFHCSCPSCYSGQFCDHDPCDDAGDICGDHGKCVFNVSGVCENIRCNCYYGWGGNFCEDQVSTLPTTMQTGSTTVFSTTTTPDPCLMSNCQHNGTCVAVESSYTCKCLPPYIGINCEIAMCDPDPKFILNAVNGTWQTLKTTRYPLYINGLNCLWTIRAPPGQTVEIIVYNVTLLGSTVGTFAVLDPLANNASLFSTNNSTRMATNVTTSDSVAKIFFDTHAASSGNFFIQYQSVYIDPCAGFSCGSNGTCIANGNMPECHCFPCYSGSICEIQKPDPCANSVCGTYGTCVYDTATCSNPHCNCAAGYSGPFCTPITDPCRSYNCGNGTCVANGNQPECHCFPCYSGSICDSGKPNPCAGNGVCGTHGHCEFNNATCSNPYCNCAAGYNPPFCT
uniref:Uncharacterized protein n=1 Tax=Plectus sambesii TaxID=2011161 RepID=A0A914VHG4_9BILA